MWMHHRQSISCKKTSTLLSAFHLPFIFKNVIAELNSIRCISTTVT